MEIAFQAHTSIPFAETHLGSIQFNLALKDREFRHSYSTAVGGNAYLGVDLVYLQLGFHMNFDAHDMSPLYGHVNYKVFADLQKRAETDSQRISSPHAAPTKRPTVGNLTCAGDNSLSRHVQLAPKDNQIKFN